MAYTVTELISYAYYTSGIVSREFQAVDGYQINDGLLLLNEILSDKTIEEDMVPYYTNQYNWTSVVGQERYFIPNLTRVDTLVFFIDSVRYAMRENFRDQYFGNGRAQDIRTLPFNWNQERTLGGMYIYLYFFPDQPYPMQLTGLFSLQSVVLNQDLTLILDPYYISYLKYRLVDKLCILYNYEMPPGAMKELLKYEQLISNRSGPMDLHMTKISTLSGDTTLSYAQANLGKGWTV